jgi:hypothetical protein
MSELSVAVQCPLPGFEDVSVVYNMLASEAQADALWRSLGRKRKDGDGAGGDDDPTHGVILRVEGWDAARYGADPWDYERGPVAFRVWAARRGWGHAVTQLLNDPNY